MGRPGRLVDVGVQQTTAALNGAREELARLIYDAPTLESAQQRIDRWGPDGNAWHRLGDTLFVTTVKADMAGQLMVKRDVGAGRFVFAEPGKKVPFLDQPWVDAINEFRARGIVKPSELSTLLGDYAQRAVVARQLMLENIQTEVRAQLEKALTEGGTYQEFAQALDEKKVPLGIADVDPSYLKMVFRTNTMSAYGAGRFRAMTDPDVIAERPFVEYRTVNDARVREQHRILHKTVYRADSEEWYRIAPPNSYNCRCAAVPITAEEARGSKVLSEPPKAYEPDPDFDSPPVAKLPKSLVQDAANTNARRVISVPEQLQRAEKEPPPSTRVGAPAEQVFGRRISDADLDAMTGATAKLPTGLTMQVHVDEPKGEPKVRAVGGIKNDKGEVVGSFTRTYKRNEENELVVINGQMTLHEQYQGTGLGSRVFNAQMDGYQQAGVAKVHLDAIDVGKYVWTKAGFDWDDAAQLERVRVQLRDYLAKRFGDFAAERIVEATRTPLDIARLVVDGQRIGKEFLIGLDEVISMTQTPSKITRL